MQCGGFMKRRTLFTLFLFLMALVATPAAAQEIPAGEEPPALDEAPVGEEIPVAEEEPSGADQAVRFEFREASLDSIIEYLSEVTPWTVVKAKDSSTKITAVSDNRVPVSQVLDFLDTALRPAGLASMRLGNVVVIDDADKV